MSELVVGSIAGLASNSYVVEVASGSQLTQPGMVLQVVSTAKTDTFTASVTGGTFSSITGLSVSITPSATTSKILVLVSVLGGNDSTLRRPQAYRLLRDGSPVGVGVDSGNRKGISFSNSENSTTERALASAGFEFLDSPASTSSLTYSVAVSAESTSSTTVYVNRNELDDDQLYTYRGISTITVMEIAG